MPICRYRSCIYEKREKKKKNANHTTTQSRERRRNWREKERKKKKKTKAKKEIVLILQTSQKHRQSGDVCSKRASSRLCRRCCRCFSSHIHRTRASVRGRTFIILLMIIMFTESYTRAEWRVRKHRKQRSRFHLPWYFAAVFQTMWPPIILLCRCHHSSQCFNE